MWPRRTDAHFHRGVNKREKKKKKTSLCVPDSRLKPQEPKSYKEKNSKSDCFCYQSEVLKVFGDAFWSGERALLMITARTADGALC